MGTRSKLNDFEILSRLGSGSFGTVFKVKRFIDENIYVIKNVRIVELSYKEQSEAINEVQILAQLKSPYVVRYFDSFIEKDSLHIVMEFCNRGDLQNLIRKAKDKNVSGLKESVIWNISLQIMLGLQYLHRKHILHRDLKTANVFLMKDETKSNYLVKIGDLGVAKLMDTSTALANTIVGTPYYLSPELCADMPYRDKSDCWAFGVLVYECATLVHPFEARNQCALILKIIEAQVKPPSSSSVSHQLRSLILWLLTKDPNARPSIKDILNEKFVREKMEHDQFELPEELRDAPVTDRLNIGASSAGGASAGSAKVASMANADAGAAGSTSARGPRSDLSAHSGNVSGGAAEGGGGGGGGGGAVTGSEGGNEQAVRLDKQPSKATNLQVLAQRSQEEQAARRKQSGGAAAVTGLVGRRPSQQHIQLDTGESAAAANGPSAGVSNRGMTGGKVLRRSGSSTNTQAGSSSSGDAKGEHQNYYTGTSGSTGSTNSGGGLSVAGSGMGANPAAPAAYRLPNNNNNNGVRGDRVRGPSSKTRTTSDTAMNRYQVKAPSAATATVTASLAAQQQQTSAVRGIGGGGGGVVRTGSQRSQLQNRGATNRETGGDAGARDDDSKSESGGSVADMDEFKRSISFKEADLAEDNVAVGVGSVDGADGAEMILRADSKLVDAPGGGGGGGDDDQYDDEGFEEYDAAADAKEEDETIRRATSSGRYSENSNVDGAKPGSAEGPAVGKYAGSANSFDDTVHRSRPGIVLEQQHSNIGADGASGAGGTTVSFRDTGDSSIIVQQHGHDAHTSTMQGDSDMWAPVWTQKRGVIQSTAAGGHPQRQDDDGDEAAPQPHTRGGGGGGTLTTATASDYHTMYGTDMYRDTKAVPDDDDEDEEEVDMSNGGGGAYRKEEEEAEEVEDEDDIEREIGPLMDMIDGAKDRAVSALGETLFWKVYDLCAKHMSSEDTSSSSSSSSSSGSGKNASSNQAFVRELEGVLCEGGNGNTSIDAACEAVFSVKLLLALESKYDSIITLQKQQQEDYKHGDDDDDIQRTKRM